MPGYVLINFFIYALINSFTPGPGNILALNTVSRYGIKKGRPLFLGIFAGYYSVQILCAVIVYGLGSTIPGVLTVIKYLGAVYILWLAVSIASSKLEPAINEQSSSFFKGFLLQFANVKVYLFGMTALSLYVVDYFNTFQAMLAFVLTIATIGTIATATWIGMGALIQKFYQRHFRLINIVLALMLLECVYSILC